ncbi:type 4 pilus major pilin [Francisella sp. 19X1-34]|uniref:type 4 pilus major pilin n=1 Tax=Francisella sp. 19X1-34 TaxID=3087177 RepID=UPI002E30F8FC|nr:type 4 pilus major pilin [Francisella sp. 19X1-34]MED7788493.1 type 4 pilus major pilin [Francisella sp. 19X1-34]
MKKIEQKGFSLVELMIVLAVIAFLVIAIMTISKVIWGKTDASSMENDITILSEDIHSLYSETGGDYTGLNNKILLKQGIVPSTLIIKNSDDKIGTVWHSSNSKSLLDVSSNNYDGGSGYNITLHQIPKGGCVDLATHFMKSAKIKIDNQAASNVSDIAGACHDNAKLVLNFS